MKSEDLIKGRQDPVSKNMLEEIGKSIRIMARLRAPDGCPWDRAQTPKKLLANLLEETYEVIHAVEEDDQENYIEELGDLLLQVLFHAQLASEKSQFDMTTIARGLNDKLINRHPHVFGEVKADNEEEALNSWNSAKNSEGAQKGSLASVPPNMPALMRARKVVDKAGKVGFEWPDVEGALSHLESEVRELRQAVKEGDQEHIREELGDVAFMTACVARYLKECPELALQATIGKFMRRFQHIEKRLAEKDSSPAESNLAEMDSFWDEAKELEKLNE